MRFYDVIYMYIDNVIYDYVIGDVAADQMMSSIFVDHAVTTHVTCII